MKFEYFPGEIAAALCGYVGETSPETLENATGALYDLKAICENKNNSDYFRDMYRLLERVTDKMEG